MKKYGIITHYDVHNHGALLQLTALIRVLKSLNIDARALRFDKNYDFLGHYLKSKYEVSVKSVSTYITYLKEKGTRCTLYNYNKRKTLNQFKKDNNLIGDYYSESPRLDGVIVGSDEVFALHTGPTPVFFGHCLPSDKVFSYAGCFGPTTTEDIKRLHAIPFVKSGLESMSSITVRDVNSADIVEHLIGHRPDIVVDPVLLYGFIEEIKLLKRVDLPPYLLVYSYDNRMNTPEEVTSIKDYARSKGLKTVSAGFFHNWCDYNINVDPISLLAYFRDAVEVVTDTFHGSVMSIIAEAKFAAKTRESNHFKLTNLLNEYGLENRIFQDWKSLESVMNGDRRIDFVNVSHEAKLRREDSLNKLKDMVKK